MSPSAHISDQLVVGPCSVIGCIQMPCKYTLWIPQSCGRITGERYTLLGGFVEQER